MNDVLDWLEAILVGSDESQVWPRAARNAATEIRTLREQRDEAIKARWRTQDTLARVREVADRYEVITPAILHHALQDGTDG